MQKKQANPTVLIAMSGGVDSSVAAALLVKEGYKCAGVFYELWSSQEKLGREWQNNCCSLEAYHDAKKVADILGIPLFRADISTEFKKHVVDYFIKEYQSGRTPNPCVMCNTKLRFGAMLKRALAVYKADFLATGHYAIRDHVDSWRKKYLNNQPNDINPKLLRGRDSGKDQTYFLYRLGAKDLGRVIFPLGGFTKNKVRQMAKKMGLPTASKHDSQEICFVPKNGVRSFLKTFSRARSGPIINKNGERIGTHAGVGLYTVGQRHGLGALGQKPHYVLRTDVKTNTLVVSDQAHDLTLNRISIKLGLAHWIGERPQPHVLYQARGRHNQKKFDCVVTKKSDTYYVQSVGQVELLAEGQSLVVYDKQIVLGGGIIEKFIISNKRKPKTTNEKAYA